MFVRVPYQKLIVGKKYKIKGDCADYTGIYEGFVSGPYFNLMFSKVKGEREHGNVIFSTYKNYYTFKSTAQSAMERRAVNLIVRQLIGDDNFEW